jgi:hypothetical protein
VLERVLYARDHGFGIGGEDATSTPRRIFAHQAVFDALFAFFDVRLAHRPLLPVVGSGYEQLYMSATQRALKERMTPLWPRQEKFETLDFDEIMCRRAAARMIWQFYDTARQTRALRSFLLLQLAETAARRTVADAFYTECVAIAAEHHAGLLAGLEVREQAERIAHVIDLHNYYLAPALRHRAHGVLRLDEPRGRRGVYLQERLLRLEMREEFTRLLLEPRLLYNQRVALSTLRLSEDEVWGRYSVALDAYRALLTIRNDARVYLGGSVANAEIPRPKAPARSTR